MFRLSTTGSHIRSHSGKTQTPTSFAQINNSPHCHRREAPQYHIGDRVWLATQDLHLRLHSKKLTPLLMGLFLLESQINPVTFKLKLPAHFCISPTFHVSLPRPVVQVPLDGRLANPTLPASWTHVGGAVSSSTWWIGRVTPKELSWVPAWTYSVNS